MIAIICQKRGIFFILLFLVFSSTLPGYAALVKSTRNGNWNAASTWDPQRAPQDGDEIIVDVGHTVTVRNPTTLNNVILAVRGTLEFHAEDLFTYGRLMLDANSSVIVENGGDIHSDLWGIFSVLNIISVGGNIEWDGSDGTILGPSFIDTGGVQPGLPTDYIPLPIELISFDAAFSGSLVQIDWATATELNNDFFTIERSEDGVEWSIIGEVEGAGDSHTLLDYQFVDYDPIPGMSYYRLKQTDFDGQFEYFDPAVVLFELDNLLKIFPNPAADFLNITTVSELEGAIILVKNLNGQQEPVKVSLISGHQAQLQVDHLPKGIYLLEIVFEDDILRKRVVKE